MSLTQISRFTSEIVPISQRVTGDGDDSAASEGGGGFAEYALVSLQCLRTYLNTSYRMTIDLLKEMPQIAGEIGVYTADLSDPSTLCKAFNRISMSACRVLLRQSAQLHDPSKHGAIDATFYERSAREPPLLPASQLPRAEAESHEARGYRLSSRP